MQRATQIVVELLAKGSSPAEVAELTGNTVSAVCQVESKYASKIAEGKADAVLAVGGHSAILDNIETQLANKLLAMIPLETDSSKITRMMKDVNSMVRRDVGERGGASGTQVNVVSLQVPAHMKEKVVIQTNTNNDVVSVAGRDLTPASMNHVNNLAGIVAGESREQITRTEAFDDILSIDLTGGTRQLQDIN